MVLIEADKSIDPTSAEATLEVRSHDLFDITRRLSLDRGQRCATREHPARNRAVEGRQLLHRAERIPLDTSFWSGWGWRQKQRRLLARTPCENPVSWRQASEGWGKADAWGSGRIRRPNGSARTTEGLAQGARN